MTAVGAPLEVLEPDDIRELVSDWRTHLRAKNRADSTIDACLDSVAMLVNCLDDENMPMVAPEICQRSRRAQLDGVQKLVEACAARRFQISPEKDL